MVKKVSSKCTRRDCSPPADEPRFKNEDHKTRFALLSRKGFGTIRKIDWDVLKTWNWMVSSWNIFLIMGGIDCSPLMIPPTKNSPWNVEHRWSCIAMSVHQPSEFYLFSCIWEETSGLSRSIGCFFGTLYRGIHELTQVPSPTSRLPISRDKWDTLDFHCN